MTELDFFGYLIKMSRWQIKATTEKLPAYSRFLFNKSKAKLAPLVLYHFKDIDERLLTTYSVEKLKFLETLKSCQKPLHWKTQLIFII
jgi:hypothetical protein